MPHVTAADGTQLYYEEAGEGTPVVFVHEFCGDWRSWEHQLRALSRRFRCITYSARGYPPSDIPSDDAHYSQDLVWQDTVALMDHLQIPRAHLVGHSMGCYTALYLGLRQPERCLSLSLIGCGFATPPAGLTAQEYLQQNARRFIEEGSAAIERYGNSANRQPHKRKDPRGYAEFLAHMRDLSPIGLSLSMANLQGKRPLIFEMKAELEKFTRPVLLLVGDEDKNSLDAAVFLKRTFPRAALRVVPLSGHSLPFEEPATVNAALAEFFSTVDAGRWMTHRAV